MLACWVEDPHGEAFKKHLSRVADYVWVGEDGIKMQVCLYSYRKRVLKKANL